jgi:hypothetical protein
LTPARWAIQAATALFGLSLAISIAPRLQLRARPDDVASALQASGASPLGVMLTFAVCVVFTALFAILGVRVARMLEGIRWAAVSYCAAMSCAPVTLMFFGNVRHVALMGIAAAAIVALRRRDPQFTRDDVVLIPAALSCYMAFLDLGFGNTPVATLFRALAAVFFARLFLRDFSLSPLALIFQLDLLQPRISGALALAVLFLTPLMKVRAPRRIVYPIVAFLYPLAVLTLPPPVTRINFYEDGHELPVASEMMRGERPYRDIVPPHGFLVDGGLHFIGMKLGVTSLRTMLDTRLVLGALTTVAIYALTVAATGSLSLGLLAVFLTMFLEPRVVVWLRPSMALFALAATVAGTRLRSRRWFIAGGALTVLAYLVSVDFGIYSAIAALFAAFRARMLKPLLIGIAAAAVPVLVVFTIFGFALDFVRVNVVEVLGGHSAYFARPLAVPECLRTPALLHILGQCVQPLLWMAALIATCAALARSPLRARRGDGPWLIGVWIVVAAVSFISRGNFYFSAAVVPFIIAALWRLSRYARTAAIVLAVLLVLVAEPFKHAITTIPQFRAAPQMPLFDASTAAAVDAARRYVSTLKPGETFVDFANAGLLYTLLRRDLPVRQVEVALYSSEEAQREVIAAIEKNPRVRAALIAFPESISHVDGVANAERAPLVWSYLQQNFTPAFEENGVVFWRRIR